MSLLSDETLGSVFVHVGRKQKSLVATFIEKYCTFLLLAFRLGKVNFSRVMASFEFQFTHEILSMLSLVLHKNEFRNHCTRYTHYPSDMPRVFCLQQQCKTFE